VKQISLLEIVSAAALLANVVVDLSRVFHVIDSAALQAAHRCTHAPHGTLAALPTVSLSARELKIKTFSICADCCFDLFKNKQRSRSQVV